MRKKTMKQRISWVGVIAVLLSGASARAELQNVQVGGDVRIRGLYLSPSISPDNPYGPHPGLRWPADIGRAQVTGTHSWSSNSNTNAFVEQRTKLHVKADFTDHVSAFIELDSYDVWGSDFRANYITGADNAATTTDDVEINQAYIDLANIKDTPFNLRIGRQEIVLGSGWLIGKNENKLLFTGLSFDAVNLSYATDDLTLGAVWAKGFENSSAEEDGDVDLYVAYANYTGIENLSILGYWILGRDARSVKDTNEGPIGDALENLFGVDNYSPTELNTTGLRLAGKLAGFDYDVEAAYQFGNAGQVGHTFAQPTNGLPYGDNDAKYDAWAGTAEVGYTFDTQYAPRVFLGAAFYGGEDERKLSFFDWVNAQINPFYRSKASVSFDRLFSDVEYGILDRSDLSNVWLARGGVTAHPTESITLGATVSYFQSLAAYEAPVHTNVFGHPLWLPGLTFLTRPNDKDLGIETGLTATYNYTSDLQFEAGWYHLFSGDGLTEGNYSLGNGLLFTGGSGKSDADYVYVGSRLTF